jgi:hypothetical protein
MAAKAKAPQATPAPGTWQVLGDVPEGSHCILAGETVRVVAQLGAGTLYRDAAGNGPLCKLASTPLVDGDRR